MTPDPHPCNSRLRQAFAVRLKALRERTDEGQALVLAMIIVLLIGLLPAIILSSLNQEMPYASETVNYESALAAAEAGVQEYANLMDQYPGYFDYAPQAGGANSTNDPGLPGGPNNALGAWETIAGTSPLEAFTYYPDTSELTATQSATNPFGGDVLLVVTGKAGTGQGTQYRRIEAAFSLSGVLTDVYFSNFEQPGDGDLDQWENTYQCNPVGSNTGPNCNYNDRITGTHEFDEATATTPCGSPATVNNCYTAPDGATDVPMATALCQYDADQPNTFIDWYSQYVSSIYPQPGYPDAGTAYSETNNYYGPWYGNFIDPLDTAYQFGFSAPKNSASGGPMVSGEGDQSACNTNYWITGDTFDGPVYSQDELTTCGAPAFTGSGHNLTTAVPPNFPFPATASTGWPGQKKPALVSGSYISEPYGYDWDPWQDGGLCEGGGTGGTPDEGVNAPSFTDPASPHLGISQSLPSANQGLLSEIESGRVAGCVYTGPTMIRFSYNTSTDVETMSVWSPLTKQTYGVGSPNPTAIDTADNVNCGDTSSTGFQDLCGGTSCTGSNTQVTGSGAGTVQAGNFAQVPVSTNFVIAVQSLPSAPDPNSWATLPAAESNATVAGCIDPWVNPDSPSAAVTTQTCTEGDAILSGAVSYQLTISAANDIIVARSLVYGCAVNAGGTYQDNLASCQSSPDVLGLIALNDIWMAQPYNPTTNQMAPECTDNTDLAPASIAWANMVPNCTVVDPVIDAATAALTGFFEVEYWREGNGEGGTIYFNGSDAVNNAGQFGVFGSGGLTQGYYLDLNYDGRLLADSPPQYLPATDGVWGEAGWVTCGSTSPNPSTAGYPTSSVPACTPLGGAYAP